jgi:hypothetical protein
MDKVILICATGRSGSTTLQRIINTIPNSNICGENFAAINSLLEFYRRIKYSSTNKIPGNLNPISYNKLIENNFKPSWYNSYKYDEVVDNIKKMIILLFKNTPETNVWGFKEVRYNKENLSYVLDFKELFPQTKFIMQIRENIGQQSKSAWFKHNKNAIEELYNNSNDFIEFYKNNKEYCFFITFEKMFDLSIINKLFIFLNCQEHFHREKILHVLNNNLKD